MKQIIYTFLIFTTFLTGCSDEYSLETAEEGMPSCAVSNIAHNNIDGNIKRSMTTIYNLNRYALNYAKENKEKIKPLHYSFYEEVVAPTNINRQFINLRKQLCQDNPGTSYRSAHIYSLGMIYDKTRESYPAKFLTKTEFLDDVDEVIEDIYTIWKIDVSRIDHIDEEAVKGVTQDMFEQRLINKIKTSNFVFIAPSLLEVSNDLDEEFKEKRRLAYIKEAEEARIEREKLNKAFTKQYTAEQVLRELENSFRDALYVYHDNSNIKLIDNKTVETYIPYKVENLLESINDYPKQIYKIEANIALPNKYETGKDYQPTIDKIINIKNLLNDNSSKYNKIKRKYTDLPLKIKKANDLKYRYEASIRDNSKNIVPYKKDYAKSLYKGKTETIQSKRILKTIKGIESTLLRSQNNLAKTLSEIEVLQKEQESTKQDILTYHKDIIIKINTF